MISPEQEAVVAQLDHLSAHEDDGLPQMIRCLIIVESSRAHLELGYTSMFDFCTRRQRWAKDRAARRLSVARLARLFPAVLQHLAERKLTFSAILLLRSHLTEANVDGLLASAAGKTVDEVLLLLAERFPRPDVQDAIVQCPPSDASDSRDTEPPHSRSASPQPLSHSRSASPQPLSHSRNASPRPLSPGRFELHTTIDAETLQDLEEARALLRHRNPSGDIAFLLKSALKLLVKQARKERLAETDRPRAARPSKDPGYVTRETRRAVVERDGAQCTYVSPEGVRCESRDFLELDHIDPRARGGKGTADNLTMRCRAHNQLAAEHAFGRAHVERKIQVAKAARLAKASPSTPPAIDEHDGERVTNGMEPAVGAGSARAPP